MQNSIRTRLAIAFIALTAGLLLLVGLVLAWQSYITEQEQVLEMQSERVQRISTEVLSYIQARENALTQLVTIRGLGDLNRSQQIQLMSELVSYSNAFNKLSLVGGDGREKISISSTEVINQFRDLSSADEFKSPVSNNQVYYGPVQFSENTGEPYLIISVPVTDVRSGKATNVLVAETRLKPVWDLLAGLSLGQGSSAYIVDTQNRVVAHNNPSVVLRNTSFTLPNQDGMHAGVSGTNVVLATNRIKFGGQEFTVVTEIPATEALAEVYNTELTLAGLLLVAILIAGGLGWFAARQIVQPIETLVKTAQAISAGDLSKHVEVTRRDEIGTLAEAFNRMTAQLRDFIASLESRVAERTRNLELAAEVGRTVSQVRSLDVMLKDAAELIRKQFDLYYVQVYLADASQTNLILQSGTGSVGEQLISRGHQLPLNTSSINGRAAVEKKSVVISDTTASATFKPNPLLPDTRSEMAVPLLIGDKVVGVLDMQSEHPDSLNQEVLSAFEALAGQLAIAIQNANLLAEAEQARAEVEAQARRLSRSNWTEYLDAIHKPEETGFVFEHNKITPLMREQAEGENATAAPITVTGETLGKLVVEMEGRSSIVKTEELVNTVARQVAQHIENLRLLDSAERYRAEAEQASRRLTHEGWQEYMADNAVKGLGYIYDLNEVRPFKQDEEKQAEESGISLPLKVRDEAVGRIIVKGVEGEEAADLVNAVAERLGAHIEGLRLSMQTEQALAATKKQAQREQALRQITSAVRGSNDPAIILRTAARELGNILGRQTVVKLATAGEAKAAQADHPAEIAGETVANNGNESVSSADRS